MITHCINIVTQIQKKSVQYVTAKNVGYLFRELPTISTTVHSKSESQKFNRFNRGIRLFFFAKSATSQFSTRQRTPLSTASAGRTRPSENPTWVKHLAKTACKLSCKRLPVMSSNQQRASKMCISTNRAKLGEKKTIPRDSDSLEAKYTTSSAPRCWEKLI